MDIKQEIIDTVIYSGNFNSIRGIIFELGLVSGNIEREDFTGALFWMKDKDQYALAYNDKVMVLNKNGTLHGVAKYDASTFPSRSEDDFTLGGGALSLSVGML